MQRKHPFVYHPRYAMGTKWLKHLHKLDLDKPGDIFNGLIGRDLIKPEQVFKAPKVTSAELHSVHSTDYVCNKLTDKKWLSEVFQVEAIGKVPYAISKHLILTPVFYHTGGTILAGELATEKGWAMNLGGGAHHAHAKDASGFCAVADISISIEQLRQKNKAIKNVMIIDLDAHQGNGHERDFMYDSSVYILDMFTYGELPNGNMFYPDDQEAMDAINTPIKLDFGTKDDEYLQKLKEALGKAENEFAPDIIYYVAGADILEDDQLGKQSITKNGFFERDQMVFDFAKKIGAPIVTVQAGGYQENLGNMVAESIENLCNRFDLLE